MREHRFYVTQAKRCCMLLCAQWLVDHRAHQLVEQQQALAAAVAVASSEGEPDWLAARRAAVVLAGQVPLAEVCSKRHMYWSYMRAKHDNSQRWHHCTDIAACTMPA